MGELFERAVPHTALPWTGERLTTGVTGQVEIEHFHRYAFARDLCRGLDVLDIASGEGYGSALMAQVARSVVGVEIDPAVVTHAQAAYQKPNLRFVQGDARAIPLPDASMDAIVSFETIEHFYEHAAFIAETRRVLRPSGRLVISSPERDTYSLAQHAPNPYHVRELTRGEFARLLHDAFPHVTLYAQRPFLGAALVAEHPASGPLLTFERRGETHFEACADLPRPLYWVAVASASPVPTPAASLYIDTPDVESIYARLRAATHEAASLREQVGTLQPQAEDWRQQLLHSNASYDSLQQRLAHLSEEAETWRQGLLQRTGDVAALEQRLATAQDLASVRAAELAVLQAKLNTLQADLEQRLATAQDLANAREAELAELQADLERRLATAQGLASVRGAALAEEQARSATLQAETEQLQRTASAGYASLHAALAAAVDHVANAEHRLSEVYSSTSWRLTGPMRGIVARHPGLLGYVRRAATGNPAAARFAVGMLRACWRLATMRSPRAAFAPPEPVPASPSLRLPPLLPLALPTHATCPAASQAIPQIASSDCCSGPPQTCAATPNETCREPDRTPALQHDPQTWFFLGDTIEWLTAHAQLTGVGRVTAELFFASLRAEGAAAIPCALAPNPEGLASLAVRDSAAFLAARTGTHDLAALLDPPGQLARPPATAFAPTPGDHMLFTGVVWTPSYATLFESLAAKGIRFSVLVYDIIPLENPEYVSDAHQITFTDWLRTTLRLADTIFVSSAENRDQLLRWVALAEAPLTASVAPIAFGANKPAPALPAGQLLRAPATMRVRADGFVLSVGTIDGRKNQAALCRLWPRLRAALPGQAPQLVLVGRDDVGLETLSDEVAALMEAGDILVLQGVADAELAGLYDACLFTAFPSLSEGYGLPVAESLAHGKLCVASDLAVIRDHAGDLPWYVPPGDEAALEETLRRAITDTLARAEAEERIACRYATRDWAETWRAVHAAVAAPPGARAAAPIRPDLPGIARVEVEQALRRARRWCTETAPDVSILIVNWNAAPLTLECIRQIWANTEGVRYEIIIADNGSDPVSLRALCQLGRGVRLLELGVNRYFGEANNIAAEQARGSLLCLLNNDAFVQPGWLRALAAALDNDKQAGAAGPLFLFPDGAIQEAGGSIDAHGYPVRAARGEAAGTQEFSPGTVDYVSAAALLVRTECFLQAGGFDLTYEPAYYEDVDLCFKLRALGRPVLFCPAAQVVHVEGAAANDDPAAVARRNALGDLNRAKFTARWSAFLQTRCDDALRQIAARVLPPASTRAPAAHVPGAQTAVLFTPYPLTPGGGERFLLTTAAALSEDHVTTIVTPHLYSRLRLLDLGRELMIDLSRCRLATEAEMLAEPAPDHMITMGNHIAPPIPARAKNSVFACQFPFPLEADTLRAARDTAGPYRLVVAYSEYARAHVLAGLSAHQMPAWPVEIVHPPVPQYAGDAGRKRRMVLTVGRFFVGAHNKRHDLMIDAFRLLLERTGLDLELHIAGSSTPNPAQMEYLAQLQRRAEDLPVTFHVNVSNGQLAELYRDAALYWHATGLDAPLAEYPAAAEHFGISVLEAMSAGCVPLAFNAGGPREIVTHGVDGILYDTLHELTDSAAQLLEPGTDHVREAMGHAAARRAAAFAPPIFHHRIRELVLG